MLAPESPAAETPDPLVLSDFDWKPGHICTYDINHSGKKARWNLEVIEVSGSQMTSAYTKVGTGSTDAVPVVDVKTGSGIKSTAGLALVHGTPLTAEPGLQWIAFPLAPKKKWKGDAVVSGTSAGGKPWKVRSIFSSKAASRWKKVKTPAGDTLALKIVTKEKIVGLSANFEGTGRLNYWIGRGGCPIKKLKYKNSFKESASLILVSERAP